MESAPKKAKLNLQKKVLIGGNWKCNGTVEKVKSLVEMLNAAGELPDNTEVVVSPTSLHTSYLVNNLRKDINVSVQNIWSKEEAGAWTGEITVDLVKNLGVNWTILGHSERRGYCGETPEIVASKVKIALDAGMNVIACIGEKLEDREAGKTMDICIEQLDPILEAIPSGRATNVVIAYEPVWAIGTGVTATPEQAQDIHEKLRSHLAKSIGNEGAASMRIIYGGSVKATNCDELLAKADIDGFLVGGASLKNEFIKIINSAKAKANPLS